MVSFVLGLLDTVSVLLADKVRSSSWVFSRLLDHNAVPIALCLHFSLERE